MTPPAIPDTPAPPARATHAHAVGGTRTRLVAMAFAVSLPLLLSAALRLPWVMHAAMDSDGRALVWVDADAATVARLRARIAEEPMFTGGLRAAGGDRPDTCGASAWRLHFDLRRSDEAQATREALERLARDAGARVCATQHFELNVPPDPRTDPAAWWRGEAWHALVMVLLPLGVVCAAFSLPWAAPVRRVLADDWHASPWRVFALATGACMAVAMAAAILTAGAVPGWTLPQRTGLSPWFALADVLLVPVLHELVFRGWFVVALRGWLRPAMIAVASVVASVVLSWPVSLFDGISTVAIAAACALAWWRSGSVLPAIAVHVAGSGLVLAWLLSG